MHLFALKLLDGNTLSQALFAQGFFFFTELNLIDKWMETWLLSLDGRSGEEAVSDQNIDFEDIENDSFENIFEFRNISQILNVQL